MLCNRLIAILCVACVSVNSAAAGEAFFDSNGVRLRYLDSGKGDAVILLHGLAVPSAEMMWVKNPLGQPKVIAELEPDFRVLALEFRGHGKSDKPTDPKAYGQEMVEDVVRLMDHLQIKQAHVVGYSLGAVVSGKLLVTHPDRLLSVTFGGGSPIYQPTKKTTDTITELAESLERGDGAGPLISLIAPAGEPPPPKQAADLLGQGLVLGQNQKALAGVVRGFTDLEVTQEQLTANKVPTMFVYGSKEGEAKERILRVTKLLPETKIHVIEGADHLNTFAKPKFRKSVHAFLKTAK